MKDFYSDFIKDGLWLIEEPKWTRHLQNVREAQFALGNGYLGTRGVLEEIPYDAMPGTYITGVYDKMGSQVDELVNLPNPINFRFTIQGEKLDLVATEVLEHKRALNTKKAVLVRRTLYRDTKKKRYNYQSLRFVSMHNKNIGAMQINITALDGGCSMDIHTGIDSSVANAGILSEGRKRHFRTRELGQSHRAGYLVIETLEKKHLIVCWSGFYYEINGRKIYAEDNAFRLRLKKGQTLTLTKIFCIKRFPYRQEHNSCKKEAFRIFYKAFRGRFSSLLSKHIKVWEKVWKKSDIEIEGAENLQRNLRFNIYHMLICAHWDGGFSSIGARTLSGEGYRGHIFWDAEIFLLPFYLFNFPKVARNMLLYRYRRLDKARELAQSEGFKGAKFAWESASTGDDETPEWSKDLDQTVIKIYTHRQEHHISADIAYAIYKYFVATSDEKFMTNFGYEMIFETARFWASRVEYNKRRKKYEIKHIIGPDEFHRDVDNNAFTNMMAKWNLICGYKLFFGLKKNSKLCKNLKQRLNLTEKEVKHWKKIAVNIIMNIDKNNVIEQFDGYFKLKKIPFTRTNENGIPLIPARIKPKNLGKTQIVKQADVVMLLCLLDDVFSLKTKIANYDFYIQRTVHKSSLSPSIHSLVGCEVGDLNRAYSLFKASLHTDISDVYRNTSEGIHAASLGGTWQAVIFGFAGVKIRREKLTVNPRLPGRWSKLTFHLLWRDDTIKFELTNDTVKIKVYSRKRKGMELGVFDRMLRVKVNRVYTFKRAVLEAKREGFY